MQARCSTSFGRSVAGLGSAIGAFTVCVMGTGACVPDCPAQFWVRGAVVDENDLTGLTDAVLGARSFTDGRETDYFPPFTSLGTQSGPTPAEDGAFEMDLSTGPMPCDRVPPFPRPDQVEIIVVRDECIQTFMITINEDTVMIDDDDPYDVILELIDPILVPPCID